MELFVDRRDGRTLTDQLYQQLRDAIAQGTLGAGDRLTSSRTVSAELGVARSTVSEAYARLVAEGYIEGHAGGGSVVAALTSLPPPHPETDKRAGSHATSSRHRSLRSAA